MSSTLLEIADELRAIATTGTHFAENEFDRERYKSLLGLAARLASTAGAGPAEQLERIYGEADRGYVTPKLDVRLAVFRDGPESATGSGGDRVLLVRERSDGRWCLPGGYVDVGESPSEAARRETREEASVTVRVTGLVGIFDNRLQPQAPPHLFQIYKLLFTGELVEAGAEPSAGSEADAAAFHPVARLPELSLGRTLPAHVAMAHSYARGESPRTHFD